MKIFLYGLCCLIVLAFSCQEHASKLDNDDLPINEILPDCPNIVVNTTYSVSDSGKAHFLDDATNFTIDYLFANALPCTSLIRIPDSLVNRFLFPLAYLYDSRDSFPLLDTLIIQKGIHKKTKVTSGLILTADTANQWMQNVHHGIVPTGNATFDSLLLLYSLEINSTLLWGFNNYAYVIINTTEPLNTKALAKIFNGVPGVGDTQPDTGYNVLTKLEIETHSGYSRVIFYYGYGDCMSGCFGYNKWTFDITTNGVVSFQGHEIQ